MPGLADHLNKLSDERARAALERCCGSSRWVSAMLAERPFGSDQRVFEAARENWDRLTPTDWLEAFAHHPRIGDRAADAVQTHTADLSQREQSGMQHAQAGVRAALAEGNIAYEERFGHVFLICATGRTPDELLVALQTRLTNDPETELRIAADEQARITELRLKGLTTS